MFELTAESDFSASHLLEGYDGPCGRLHGHNYGVQVTVEAEALDHLGMAFDLRILKQALRKVLADFDHAHLNDLPGLAGKQPSAENIAQAIFERLEADLLAADKLHPEDNYGTQAKLKEVRVAESDHSWVTYKP